MKKIGRAWFPDWVTITILTASLGLAVLLLFVLAIPITICTGIVAPRQTWSAIREMLDNWQQAGPGNAP